MEAEVVTRPAGASCYRGSMPNPVLLCTDGSADSLAALSAGLDLIGRNDDLVLVTVVSAPDPGSLSGSGLVGPDMSPEEYESAMAGATESGEVTISAAQEELEISGAPVRVLWGDAGTAICQLAVELSARAIVVGSRGRGRLKRALLGSVSDYVVRNAPCSVIVTRSEAGA